MLKPSRPDPELIDDENPEWTEGDFAQAVPFSGLSNELQELLSQSRTIEPDAGKERKKVPAA